jgi:hypothetical protein
VPQEEQARRALLLRGYSGIPGCHRKSSRSSKASSASCQPDVTMHAAAWQSPKRHTLSSASQLSKTEFLDRKRRRLAPFRTAGAGVRGKAPSSLSLPSSASAQADAARVCSSNCSCTLLRLSKASPDAPGVHLEAMEAARSTRGHSRAHRTGSESLMQSSKRVHVNTCGVWVSAADVAQVEQWSQYRSPSGVASLACCAPHSDGGTLSCGPAHTFEQKRC